jgi:hypothetical protein
VSVGHGLGLSAGFGTIKVEKFSVRTLAVYSLFSIVLKLMYIPSVTVIRAFAGSILVEVPMQNYIKNTLAKNDSKLKKSFGANIQYIEVFLLGWLAVSTLLFPKAGINTNGVPLTVNLSIVLIVIVVSIFRFFQQISFITLIVISLLIPWFFLVSVRSNSLVESRTLKFGAVYWFVIVPLFWIAIEILLRNNRKVPLKIVLYCSFAATFFGLGQYLYGLKFLKVPGLTLAWGDIYERKNLTLFNSGISIGTKIPSTFQGGNIWGQCSALILVWIIVFQVWKVYENRLMKMAVVLAPIIAILLSFSRTAVVAALITILFYIISNSKINLRRVIGSVFCILVLLISQPINFDRFSLNSLTDSAGRTTQWQIGFENYSLLDWLIGRSTVTPGAAYHMEGLLGLFGQVGIFGFLLLSFIWIQYFGGQFKWLGLCIFICLFLDSTYVSPPLLLIPAVLKLASRDLGRDVNLDLGEEIPLSRSDQKKDRLK